jgi:hypothetical protein
MRNNREAGFLATIRQRDETITQLRQTVARQNARIAQMEEAAEAYAEAIDNTAWSVVTYSGRALGTEMSKSEAWYLAQQWAWTQTHHGGEHVRSVDRDGNVDFDSVRVGGFSTPAMRRAAQGSSEG